MPELLKDRFYNRDSINALALSFRDVYPSFQVDDFINDVIDGTWDDLELKARMHRITINLGKYLPDDYEQALDIIDNVIEGRREGVIDFALMCFPDFVEVFGQDECHWDISMAALERYTRSSSSEFAVRPFIINNEERMMSQMAVWSRHENEHVRRLSSEGCRPQLPWGQVLHSFKKDPSKVIVILEQLKADPSLYVRKSVANNLNDISKTHPDLVIKIAKEWYGDNEYTDWIVKHACRTLLKKGDREVLAIFGYDYTGSVDVDGFALVTTSVANGEDMTFLFEIEAKETTKVRLEYGIDFVKANGKRNRKIFQISEIELKTGQRKKYKKTHSFADMSTRRHYPGVHSVTLIVNGIEQGTFDFELLAAE